MIDARNVAGIVADLITTWVVQTRLVPTLSLAADSAVHAIRGSILTCKAVSIFVASRSRINRYKHVLESGLH